MCSEEKENAFGQPIFQIKIISKLDTISFLIYEREAYALKLRLGKRFALKSKKYGLARKTFNMSQEKFSTVSVLNVSKETK